MPKPLVSVILPVYNAEVYIAEAINSIISQSYTYWELLLIDDGSTDKSLEIMQSYTDTRITIISRENRGLIESLNEGIKKAKGKYVARMDADDISLPKRFQRQVEFMEMYPEIGICGTAVVMFGEKLKEQVWRLPLNDIRIKTELLFSSSLAHPTVMMKRELIEKYQLFYNPTFQHAEDFELWTRFAEHTTMMNLSEPLLKYRVLENSVSRLADKKLKQRYSIMKKIPDRYMEKLKIERDENQKWLHFNLSTNIRMKESKIDFKSLNSYFSLLLNTNESIDIFDSKTLKKVLGKKWLINFYYSRDIRALFSKYMFYGIWGILTK